MPSTPRAGQDDAARAHKDPMYVPSAASRAGAGGRHGAIKVGLLGCASKLGNSNSAKPILLTLGTGGFFVAVECGGCSPAAAACCPTASPSSGSPNASPSSGSSRTAPTTSRVAAPMLRLAALQ